MPAEPFQLFRLRHPARMLARPAVAGELVMENDKPRVCRAGEVLGIIGPILMVWDGDLFDRLYEPVPMGEEKKT